MEQTQDVASDDEPQHPGASLSSRLAGALTHYGIIALAFPLIVVAARILFVSRGNPAIINTLAITLNFKAATLSAVLTLLPNDLLPWIAIIWSWLESQSETLAKSKNLRIATRAFLGILCTVLAFYSTLIAVFTLLKISSMRHQRKSEAAKSKTDADVRELEKRVNEAQGSADRDALVRLIEDIKRKVSESNAEISRLKSNIKKRERSISRNTSAAYIMGGALVAILFFQLMVSSLWLPAEDISLRNEPARVAYVLDSSNGDLVLLYANTTEIRRARQTDVLQRKVCDQRGVIWLTQTLAYLIDNTHRTPACPA
jgi:hypothetical protein